MINALKKLFRFLLHLILIMTFSGLCILAAAVILHSLDLFEDPIRIYEPPITYTKSDIGNNVGELNDFAPHTRWIHLAPCGIYFDEEVEYAKAIECVNTKVYPDSKIGEYKLPRCFVVTTASPNVVSNGSFNMIAIRVGFAQISGVVGFYETVTDTLFIVENIDAAMIYRHELQHLFLDIHDGLGGGGHDQEIWKQCEAPYYEPSAEAQIISITREVLDN